MIPLARPLIEDLIIHVEHCVLMHAYRLRCGIRLMPVSVAPVLPHECDTCDLHYRC